MLCAVTDELTKDVEASLTPAAHQALTRLRRELEVELRISDQVPVLDTAPTGKLEPGRLGL